MAVVDDRLRIPAKLRTRVHDIAELTDAARAEQLDLEYAELCRRLLAKLARKRPSPLERGDAGVWAAGVIYAIGQNNFLFDPSQTPHATADQLSRLLRSRRAPWPARPRRSETPCGWTHRWTQSSAAASSWLIIPSCGLSRSTA
jgi:Domain of unknown function (DUF6398)